MSHLLFGGIHKPWKGQSLQQGPRGKNIRILKIKGVINTQSECQVSNKTCETVNSVVSVQRSLKNRDWYTRAQEKRMEPGGAVLRSHGWVLPWANKTRHTPEPLSG